MSLTSRQIAHHEQKARTRHLSAFRHLGDVPIPVCFNKILEQNILPFLLQSGFDTDIAGNIFKISASAWKLMELTTNPKIRFHPAMVGHIREMRQTIESNARSWITLPRAHSFLRKDDSLFLSVYLQLLEKETNSDLKKILTRILTEFIGNYSLKFVNSSLPEKQVTEVVFYGYATLFWKNLRQPPQAQEDLLIFQNYLSWIRSYQKRAAGKDPEKEAVIAEMAEFESKILPDRHTCLSTRRKEQGPEGLHITLRHGRPGINHAVQHFTPNINSLRRGSLDLLP